MIQQINHLLTMIQSRWTSMTNKKKYVWVKKLNEVEEKEEIVVENMVYEIKGKQVMLDTKISATKCHGNYYASMVTYFDIGLPISVYYNFADASAKIERMIIL